MLNRISSWVIRLAYDDPRALTARHIAYSSSSSISDELSKQRRNWITRACIDGQKLLSEDNVQRFTRLGAGHYRFEFEEDYVDEHYVLFVSASNEKVVITKAKTYVEIRLLEDTALDIMCCGEVFS